MRNRGRAKLLLTLAVLLAVAVAAAGLSLGSRSAQASPSPKSLSVGVGGAAPASQSFSGGPITGSADGSGNVAPVSCQTPSCEAIPLTLKAPAGTAGKSLVLSVTISFTPMTGNPGGTGLDGLDVWILDSQGNVVGSPAVLGSSPATATASQLDPGAYTVEISGENAAVQETYKGTASATATPPRAGGPTPTLQFGPATLVSPVILGGEPQVSFERPVAKPAPTAGLSPDRGFVDWPVSSRTMVGTLWRTTNGGLFYRQIVDLSCAPRQVPNCLTGGGGDTVQRVNNYDGTLNFGDQESLAQEAFASSTDHGDTFPPQRQTPVTSTFTGVDRQWISSVDAPNIMAGPAGATFPVEALFSYHIPAAGELVAGVGSDGIVRPAVPVLPLVSQSGPSRVDTAPGSPGFGWFYQSYRDGSGFEVGAAPVSKYDDPTAYNIGHVTDDQPAVFPWIALDRQGNLYAVWSVNGNTYLSASLITDPANNPKATPAGKPASKWTKAVRVNPAGLGSTIFPEIVAGDAGRVAIEYMGTNDFTGVSDNAPTTARWHTYVSIATNALSASPSFQLAQVSHRVDHIGTICTSGTTCAATLGDRSLLDMIDVTITAQGRVMSVFSDNNNSFARDETSTGSEGEPFVKVAPLTVGPSLFANGPGWNLTPPNQCVTSAAGDATWPNTAAGKNIPALDETGTCTSILGGNLVARIALADASAKSIGAGLTAYNAARGNDVPASRLQYVARWEFGDEVYYAAAEAAQAGTFTYYGGKLDGSNAVSNVNSAVAVSYRPQSAYPVQGHLEGNTLVLSIPLAKIGAAKGSVLGGFQTFSLAGPSDTELASRPETSQLLSAMRMVDGTPAMDALLEPLPTGATPGSSTVVTTPAAGTGGTPGGNQTPGTGGNQKPPAGGKQKPPAGGGGKHPKGCPAATGRLTQSALGPLRIGMTRTAARHRLKRRILPAPRDEDFYCLSRVGIRAGYLDAGLLRRLPANRRAGWRSRIVLLLSANRHYALGGVRPRTRLKVALHRLRHAKGFKIGLNIWYVAPFGHARGVLKVRRGIVEEVGVLTPAVAPTLRAQKTLLHLLGA